MEENKLIYKVHVRGFADFQFVEGWMTGEMKKGGISIDKKYGESYAGGCIDRKEVVELRDFLNKCIEKWSNEL